MFVATALESRPRLRRRSDVRAGSEAMARSLSERGHAELARGDVHGEPGEAGGRVLGEN